MMILTALLLLGCVKDIDFDQAGDIVLKPVYETDLLLFDLEADQFVYNGIEVGTVTDTTGVDALSGEFSNKYLDQASLYFEFTNTISRSFRIEASFLNENGRLLQKVDFLIGPSDGSPEVVSRTLTYSGNDLSIITNTHKIAIEFSLLPGTPMLTEESTGTLSMDSKATLYLLIDE